MLAVVCPGQGAQVPGFLLPWLDVPAVAARLAWSATVTGTDLVELGCHGNETAIRDTAVAQPLLVATALAVAEELDGDPVSRVVAGHSVGELAAAVLAGALSPEAGLALVAARGRAMAAAAAAAPTGMTAILGGDPAAVEAALARHELTAANVNAAGQVVAAGPVAGLDQLAADPPAGARLRPLSVAGAFHTAAMEPARVELARLAAGVPVRDPYTTFVSNADGAVVTSGRDLLRRLVDQVSSPVRWDLCMRTLGELGVTAVVELPPAGTLTALIRRAMPEVTTLAIRTPDDLAAARQLVAEHQPVIGEPGPPWRVVVAPLAGTFRADALPTGARLAAGALLGTIESRREVVPVAAAQPGVLVEWLAHDGDPVDPGQPLVRVHPEALAR